MAKHGTVSVDGRSFEVVDSLSSGPGDPIHSYILKGGDRLDQFGRVWTLTRAGRGGSSTGIKVRRDFRAGDAVRREMGAGAADMLGVVEAATFQVTRTSCRVRWASGSVATHDATQLVHCARALPEPHANPLQDLARSVIETAPQGVDTDFGILVNRMIGRAPTGSMVNDLKAAMRAVLALQGRPV